MNYPHKDKMYTIIEVNNVGAISQHFFAKIGGIEVNKSNKKEFGIWRNMMRRCYDEKYINRHNTPFLSTVCEEWHDFENFLKWYKENYPKNIDYKFSLDKDLLQNGVKNKIYSPKTCLFLPQRINSFLGNVQINNTSGYTGVHLRKRDGKWQSNIKCFKTSKQIYLGAFNCVEEAYESYILSRKEQSNHAKEYLRNLNYLNEDIINLIK